MPRATTKADRLAKIKTAAKYPSVRESLDAMRAAKEAQTIKRAISPETLPAAQANPKHLSSQYRRAIKRYVSRISEQADIWQSELSRMLRSAKRVPVLAYRLNPVYYRVIPSPNHRNIGPLMPDYTTSTNSRESAKPLNLTPQLIAKAENLIRVIPPDTSFPEQCASRQWAEWILETPARIEAGKKLDHEIAATRQAEQRASIQIIAENIRLAHNQPLINSCRSASPLTYSIRPCLDGIGKEVYTIPASIFASPIAIPAMPTSPRTSYFLASPSRLCANRVPLHTLVPIKSA